MDENGNPVCQSEKRSHLPVQTNASSSYVPSSIFPGSLSEVTQYRSASVSSASSAAGANKLTKHRARVAKEAKFPKAEEVKDYRGRENDVDKLIHFIESNPANNKVRKKVKAGMPVTAAVVPKTTNVTASKATDVVDTDLTLERNSKKKDSTRNDYGAASENTNDDETFNPDMEEDKGDDMIVKSSKSALALASEKVTTVDETAYDPFYFTDIDVTSIRESEFTEVKKKKVRPTQGANNNSARFPQSSNHVFPPHREHRYRPSSHSAGGHVPPVAVGGKQDGVLAVNAFPVLAGAPQRTEGRRSSTGDMPEDLSNTNPDDSDLESVKSLPLGGTTSSTQAERCASPPHSSRPTVSYAKMVSKPKQNKVDVSVNENGPKHPTKVPDMPNEASSSCVELSKQTGNNEQSATAAVDSKKDVPSTDSVPVQKETAAYSKAGVVTNDVTEVEAGQETARVSKQSSEVAKPQPTVVSKTKNNIHMTTINKETNNVKPAVVNKDNNRIARVSKDTKAATVGQFVTTNMEADFPGLPCQTPPLSDVAPTCPAQPEVAPVNTTVIRTVSNDDVNTEVSVKNTRSEAAFKVSQLPVAVVAPMRTPASICSTLATHAQSKSKPQTRPKISSSISQIKKQNRSSQSVVFLDLLGDSPEGNLGISFGFVSEEESSKPAVEFLAPSFSCVDNEEDTDIVFDGSFAAEPMESSVVGKEDSVTVATSCSVVRETNTPGKTNYTPPAVAMPVMGLHPPLTVPPPPVVANMMPLPPPPANFRMPPPPGVHYSHLPPHLPMMPPLPPPHDPAAHYKQGMVGMQPPNGMRHGFVVPHFMPPPHPSLPTPPPQPTAVPQQTAPNITHSSKSKPRQADPNLDKGSFDLETAVIFLNKGKAFFYKIKMLPIYIFNFNNLFYYYSYLVVKN